MAQVASQFMRTTKQYGIPLVTCLRMRQASETQAQADREIHMYFQSQGGWESSNQRAGMSG
jgi:hypothetical protein